MTRYRRRIGHHPSAREYDPELGRFLSVDPLLMVDDQRQHNPYQYGNNSPITFSDPTGEKLYDDITGLGYGNTTALKSNLKKQGYLDSKGKTTKKYRTWLSNEKKRYQQYWNTCGSDPWCSGVVAAELRAAQIKAEREAAEQQRKKNEQDNSFWGKLKRGDIKGAASKAWDNTGGKAVTFLGDNWRPIAKWTITGTGIVATTVCAAATAGVCAGAGGVIMVGVIGAAQGIAVYGISEEEKTGGGYLDAGVEGMMLNGISGLAKPLMLMSKTGPYHSVSTMVSSALHNRGKLWKGGEYGRQVKIHMRFGTKWAD